MDEYFYRSHRLQVGWLRQRYQEALPHAERALNLENGIYAAAKSAGADDLAPFAFCMGAWGAISLLTRCKRREDALEVFQTVVADQDFFWARLRRDAASAEKVLIAGLCVFFEGGDEAWFQSGRDVVARAQQLACADNPELAYGYACYWARVGFARQTFEALEVALRRGIDLERVLEDPDLRSVRSDPRFKSLVLDRIFTWKIETDPPGAQVFIDGVDTGLLTPMSLRPPKEGRHRIQLALDGYRDEDRWEEQRAGAGLDLSCTLVSLAEVAERKKMADEAGRAPNEAERAKTQDFLGPAKTWHKARVKVERKTTYGLGGVEISVDGDGKVAIRHESFGEPRRTEKYSFSIGPEPAEGLLAAFVEEAFTEIVIDPHCGVPDELYYTLELTNAKGRTHLLGKFVHMVHPRFDRLVELVHRSIAERLDAPTRKRLTL